MQKCDLLPIEWDNGMHTNAVWIKKMTEDQTDMERMEERASGKQVHWNWCAFDDKNGMQRQWQWQLHNNSKWTHQCRQWVWLHVILYSAQRIAQWTLFLLLLLLCFLWKRTILFYVLFFYFHFHVVQCTAFRCYPFIFCAIRFLFSRHNRAEQHKRA